MAGIRIMGAAIDVDLVEAVIVSICDVIRGMSME